MSARLADFRLERGVYRLGQFAPVSIRDQVVRANFVVDGLWDEGRLRPESNLVIVGAGAAGIAAGLAAQRVGVRSIAVLERTDQYMPLQSQTSSRWLDPVQYDWPASYWDEEQWPIIEGNPRRFTAKLAPFPVITAREADLWATWFEGQAIASRLPVHLCQEVRGWRRGTTGRILVDTKSLPGGAAAQWPADAVIVATGFGWEVTTVPDTNGGAAFKGLDFWSTDQFETPNFGLPTDGQVLVSGTGDGSLQEFIRLITGEASARSVLRHIWRATPPTSPWKATFEGLGHWDQHAALSLMSVTQAFTQCDVYGRLHSKFEDAVGELETHADWRTVCGVLASMTRSRPTQNVQLLVKCTHFGKCYPLNRLVALLLIRFLHSQGQAPMATERALSSTRAIGHSCQPGCWGRPHEVTLALGTDCSTTGRDIANWAGPNRQTITDRYLGLVIRHGIRPLTSPHFPTVALSNQEVPRHLP